MICPICKKDMTMEFMSDGREIWYCKSTDCPLNVEFNNLGVIAYIKALFKIMCIKDEQLAELRKALEKK